MSASRHCDGGFSLVELMTTIVIVGVLVGIAIVTYKRRSNERAQSRARTTGASSSGSHLPSTGSTTARLPAR